MSNVKLVSTPILNYYDSKLKKFLNSTYALKSDVGSGGGILYAECSTARNIVDKAVACEGFALVKGACIAIRFTDTSTADPTTGNITLNINNTDRKSIVPKENNTAVAYSWAWAFCKNQTQVFMYNGTNFIWLNQDNNTTYTPMALGFGYGTCTTEEDVTAKVVTLTSYVLIKGGMVSVKFANAVPASATLNINGKGAKYIYYHGTKILAGIINANDIATFVYDGTEYQLIAIDNEAKIKANASDIAKNAAAIQEINDVSSGILATANKHTDTEISKVSANVTANTNAIGAINNTSTGILAQAKEYVDGILPTASVANADTVGGLHADDFARSYNDELKAYLNGQSGDIRALVHQLPIGEYALNTPDSEFSEITFPIEGYCLMSWFPSKSRINDLIYGTLIIRPMYSESSVCATYICSVYNTYSYTDWEQISTTPIKKISFPSVATNAGGGGSLFLADFGTPITIACTSRADTQCTPFLADIDSGKLWLVLAKDTITLDSIPAGSYSFDVWYI